MLAHNRIMFQDIQGFQHQNIKQSRGRITFVMWSHILALALASLGIGILQKCFCKRYQKYKFSKIPSSNPWPKMAILANFWDHTETVSFFLVFNFSFYHKTLRGLETRFNISYTFFVQKKNVLIA